MNKTTVDAAATLEQELNKFYEKYRKTAVRFGYSYQRESISIGALPCVLFMGNHSSGKSTLINHLLGGAPVQDTGVAPTDDGFTILIYGEEESDAVGLSALSLLPRENGKLTAFGPNFLNKFKVKVRNREILKRVVLIDSPGMIDALEESIRRDYDFFGAVHRMAELSDLIMLMFDPDKPGTTGEAIEALTGPLVGMSFKLRILLNKCDLFQNVSDYARAYGALCWNLAHAMPIKDLPKIYSCYVPQPGCIPRIGAEAGIDALHQVADEIRNSGERRTDNVRAAAHKDFSCLGLQMRMILRLRENFKGVRMNLLFGSLVLFLAVTGAAYFTLTGHFLRENPSGFVAWAVYLSVGVIALLTAWGAFLFSRKVLCIYRENALARLDEIFEKEYADELVQETRDDLRQYWELVKTGVRNAFDPARSPLRIPLFATRKLRDVQAVVERLES